MGILDRFRRAKKWHNVDELSPRERNLIIAIDNSGNAVCGGYKSHFIYRADGHRVPITMYNRWMLIKHVFGWHRFSRNQYPNNKQKIIAVSTNLEECVICDYRNGYLYQWESEMLPTRYKYWENYPDA